MGQVYSLILHFSSYSLGQNPVMWPCLTAKETEKIYSNCVTSKPVGAGFVLVGGDLKVVSSSALNWKSKSNSLGRRCKKTL